MIRVADQIWRERRRGGKGGFAPPGGRHRLPAPKRQYWAAGGGEGGASASPASGQFVRGRLGGGGLGENACFAWMMHSDASGVVAWVWWVCLLDWLGCWG